MDPKASRPSPPVAAKKPHETTIHGDTRVDDYHWMREKDSPEVLAHLRAENDYADALLAPVRPLEDGLYEEILGRIKQTDLSVPYPERGYFYYSRTEEGKQYPTFCRRAGSLEAPEEILLDLNRMAEGLPFLGLGAARISDDGMRLAYSLDTTGFREYTLHVKDLRTGELGSERIPKVKSVAWANDNRTLFYALDDHAKRPYRIYRHAVGSDPAGDEMIYEEPDERFRVSVWKSRSGRLLFIDSSSHTTSEARFLRADDPGGAFTLVAARRPDVEYAVTNHGESLYIRVNDRGRNFRVVRASIGSPGPGRWKEVVPHSEEVMLEGMDLFAGHLVLEEREDGLPHLRVTDLAGGGSHRITFDEPVYTVYPGQNREFETAKYRFVYQSLAAPESVFEYDMESRERALLKRTEVLGGYDPSRYESKRLHAIAKDGRRIPLSVIHRKGLALDGTNPLLLTGYGSYGFPYPVTFSHSRVSLLDRGVVCAIAHIRGGGEMGKRWHDEGRMLSKRNTFTDFIAAAEHLIAGRYTRSDRMAASGGSAGGLLMGAVANMEPRLFKIVLPRVPFVDVLNTMLDDELPLTVGEYEEWGNPNIPEQYAYMKSYCPYTNLGPRAYPAMFVITSYNDSQVMYWEPAKYVAKLREVNTGTEPVLFKINMAGGHGGSSGRYDKLRETAMEYAWMLHVLGAGE